ncbi:hypothetical protein FRC02_006255 [Tulasnella sp. 418]|nr:hypothetical protein FRC02_006255 [Tulasnella sp. 418]
MTTSFSSHFDDSTNHSGNNTVSGGTPTPSSSSSQPSTAPRVILSPPSIVSINDVSDVSIDMNNISTSIPTILSESTEPDPDPAIIDALKNPKERLFVLKLGESMESLIAERTSVQTNTFVVVS